MMDFCSYDNSRLYIYNTYGFDLDMDFAACQKSFENLLKNICVTAWGLQKPDNSNKITAE